MSEEDIKSNFLVCLLGAKNRIADKAAKEKIIIQKYYEKIIGVNLICMIKPMKK